MDVIYLDFGNTFATVSQNILLEKLAVVWVNSLPGEKLAGRAQSGSEWS